MLPDGFLDRPFAHRALHDRTAGRIENSRAAVSAAVAAGYGIEIDLQLSADGRAMVFHDYDLGRLTGARGLVRRLDAADLAAIALTGSDEGIPTLSEILALVAGRVPLLIEVKDQDGALGPDVGRLEKAVAADLSGYAGPVAVMSFNPYSMAAAARLMPGIPRGLTTEDFTKVGYRGLSKDRRAALTRIEDFDRVGACFVSHHWKALDTPPVQALKARGVPVLCWTIRSPREAKTALRVADAITFEGFAA
jgi:glycerophosphoryl diester phosphodiesterase